MTEPTITAKNLTKRFGDFTAVDGINLEVHRGEIFGLLGPNGSGKTTSIRMILGLLNPSEGTVHVLGQDTTRMPEKIRPRVGYMSQRFSLYNDLTVMQNLRFYGKAYGLSNNELAMRIKEALENSGLVGRENTLTRDLSGGWRQRLALSAAILHQPEVVFLDEPTAGVDPISRRLFWDLLYQMVANDMTVFVTTHYMDEAEHCHRLAFIQRGRISAHGSPESIKRQAMRGEVLEIAPSDPIQTVQVLRQAADDGRLPLQEISLYGSLVHVVTNDMKRMEKAIRSELKAHGIEPGNFSTIAPSLEDVFIASMKS
jgi:ABC-2 type transport system ATP-binding protein